MSSLSVPTSEEAMDITPMEEAMMQQLSEQGQALQNTQDTPSTDTSDQHSSTVMDTEPNSGVIPGVTEIQSTSDGTETQVRPGTGMIQEQTEDRMEQANSGDDSPAQDKVKGEELEANDGTSTEEGTKAARPICSLLRVRVQEEDCNIDDRVEDVADGEPTGETESDGTSSNAESGKHTEEISSEDINLADQLFCAQCSKQFKRRLSFEKHIKTHGEEPLLTEIDKKGPGSQKSPEKHRRRTRKPRFVGPSTCDVCNKVFEKRKSFTNHRRTCGTHKVFPCKSCSKIFERSDSLRNHTIKYHTEIPPQHQCEICGKQFYKRDKLFRHQLMHNPDGRKQVKKFKCDTCSGCFSSRAHLEIHIRTHTGEKPFLCEHCGKQFTAQRDARKHVMRMHTNYRLTAKLHFCSVCHKSFLEKSNMLKHVNAVHSGNRPFSCEQCEYRAKTKRDIQRHQARHMADKPFSCHICDKKYNSKEALGYHKRAHHGMDKVYECKDCSITFHVREAYNHHLKNHKKAEEEQVVWRFQTDDQGMADEEEKAEEKAECNVLLENKDGIKKEEEAGTSQEVATFAIFVPLTS